MARLETVATLRESGWSLSIIREGDEFRTFTEEILEQMREGAESRMARALDHVLGAIRKSLSKQYPPVTLAGTTFTTRSGTTRKRLGTKRRSSPPGAPPGKVTGDLAESWKRKKPTWSKGKTVLTGRYFSRHPAAGRLEFGDAGTRTKRFREGKRKSGTSIPARPYIRPMLVREADRISGILDGSE